MTQGLKYLNNLSLNTPDTDSFEQNAKERIKFCFEEADFKRLVSGKEVIVHCHHYNARLQGTIESATQVNGKEIIRSSAESVFADYFRGLFDPFDAIELKWKIVEVLYSYLGYGKIHCSHAQEGFFTASASHFVEGWANGFEKRTAHACTFTEGFLQGAYVAITGINVRVNEVSCMIQGKSYCRFEVTSMHELPAFEPLRQFDIPTSRNNKSVFVKSSAIDEDSIIDAMKNMALYGGADGLIPLFNVYLANIPSEFYNIISVRFIEEMEKSQMGEAARKLLTWCGEICALHTFRGVMNSAEWDGLISPMIRDASDNLFALLTITRGLGWGNWQVKKFIESTYLELESLNGYEAFGYRSMRPKALDPKCFMLAGVSAGLMELIYSDGALDDKFGTFVSTEVTCICCGHPTCRFEVHQVLR